MFALFFSLYRAMFTGTWVSYDYLDIFGNSAISVNLKSALNEIGLFLTSIFGDNTYSTLGDSIISNANLITLVSLILAFTTSIGIVVMAVKGVKKAFGIFFGQIR